MKKIQKIGGGTMYNYLSDDDYGWFYRKGTNHDIAISPATRKLIEQGLQVTVREVPDTQSSSLPPEDSETHGQQSTDEVS